MGAAIPLIPCTWLTKLVGLQLSFGTRLSGLLLSWMSMYSEAGQRAFLLMLAGLDGALRSTPACRSPTPPCITCCNMRNVAHFSQLTTTSLRTCSPVTTVSFVTVSLSFAPMSKKVYVYLRIKVRGGPLTALQEGAFSYQYRLKPGVNYTSHAIASQRISRETELTTVNRRPPSWPACPSLSYKSHKVHSMPCKHKTRHDRFLHPPNESHCIRIKTDTTTWTLCI